MSAPPTQEQRLATFYRKLREREARIAANKQAAEDERAAQEAARDALLADHRHPDGTPFGLEDWKPREDGLPQDERDKRYFAAAVAGILAEMSEAREGHRNHTLFVSAARIGNIAAGRNLPYEGVAVELAKVALKTGLDRREIAKTIASGIKTGLKNPEYPT